MRAIAFLLSFSALVGSASADAPGKLDFAHDVVPILKAKCARCHTNGTYKAGVSFDTRAELIKSKAVVPGKSSESELIHRVTSTDSEMRMPPKGDPLTAKEVAALKAWIDGGLEWETGFSFKPPSYVAPLRPRRPVLPPATEQVSHPIDRILTSYFSRKTFPAPAPLDDAAFARRAYLDLIGQLPAVSELQAFQADGDSGKRTRLIRRLLEDNRAYSDHWLTFWNDLLRNDYVGTGFIDGGRKPITNWLYESLSTNKPFDQFTRELIAPTSASEGFTKGIKWRGAVNASQITELQFAQNVGQVFFGVNLKCASCHDSFIDHWKLDDAYSLAAVIADKPLMEYRCDKATGRTIGPRFLFPELGTIDPKLPSARRLEQLATLVTHPENGRFTRTIANRIWHRMMGRGIVHPVDVMGNPPWSEDLLDHLGTYLSDHGYDLKKLMEHIATSRIYQSCAVPIPAEPQGEEYVFRGPEFKRLSAEQFLDGVWQLTDMAPAKPAAPMTAKLPAFSESTPRERRGIRSALLISNPLLRSLGRPNREQVVTTRPDQLSTLQALDLTNGAILADTLAQGSARLLKAKADWNSGQLAEWVFLQALSRKPTPAELTAARELLGENPTAEGLTDLLWIVVMLPEFQLIR